MGGPKKPSGEVEPFTPEQQGLFDSVQYIVERNANRLAERFKGLVTFDELMSSGHLALLLAAQRYDAARGVAFETYAQERVVGAMLDEVRVETRARAVLVGFYRASTQTIGGLPDEFKAWEHGPREARKGVRGAAVASAAAMFARLRANQEDEARAEGGAEDELARQELVARTQAALARARAGLSKADQLVLRIVYDEGYELQAAAELLGISISTMYRNHNRMLKHLAVKLRAAGIDRAPVGR